MLQVLQADTGLINPDGDGGTSDGAQTTCGAGVGNFECVNDDVATTSAPSTSDDYLTFIRDELDFYTMETFSNVATATEVRVNIYHAEGNTNMRFDVALFDQNETTQYGSTQNLPNSTTDQWDTATFSGLTLTQTQVDNLRVQVTCIRISGGPSSTCIDYALSADVIFDPVFNVDVSATSTQQNLLVGTTTAHVGGAFVIEELSSSRNVTSVKITENGTVDAQNDLTNIVLKFDLDTTSPYDCTGESYDGDEDQYGATSTGFSAPDGTITFTETQSITTTQALCLYPVLDVATTSSPGETLELEIDDPSVDVVLNTGAVGPTSTVAISGTTVLNAVDLDQKRYHWRADDGSEAAATSLTGGSEDAPYNALAALTTVRVRIEVSNEGNISSAATQYRLEYAPKISTCAAATGWTDVGAIGGDWDMSNSLNLTDGANTTDIAVSTGGVTNENTTFLTPNSAVKDTSSQTGNITLTSTEFVELEYAIISSAGVSAGDTYCFRVTDAGTALDTYSKYPEATIVSDLLLTATSTQVSTIDIPTSFIHVGGGFVLERQTVGVSTVTSITVTASGTVDYQNDLTDIGLYYDIDSTAPIDCTGESYDGDETQYGATSTSFSANATSTFTDSVLVNQTQSLCAYLVLDVSSDVTDGETLDIQINDPPNDIVQVSGTIGPSGLVDIDGMTTFVEPLRTQIHYHWRNDNGTESGATSATGGNEDIGLENIQRETTQRLRLMVTNAGGATTAATQYRLEYAQKISTCAAATGWTDVGAVGGDWDMFNSANLTEGGNTTDIAVSTGGVTNENTTFLTPNGGVRDTTSQTGNITLIATEFAELEYSMVSTVNATLGATYCFRVTDAGTEIENYDRYATSSIRAATDFFVQRGVETITASSTTLVAGVDYTTPATASTTFIRITNTQHTGAGDSAAAGNQDSDDVTTYIIDPGNIATSVTIQRSEFATDDTRVAWEIVEYTGSMGGDNEIIVRQHGQLTFGASALIATGTPVSGISNDADVAVFITSQYNPDAGRQDYNTTLSTADWASSSDEAVFTRGEASGDAVELSYTVIEFIGQNWKIQRAEHPYTAVGSAETEPITAVSNLNRTFLHVQKRVGSGLTTHADFGHEVWLSSVGFVSFQLDGNASTPSDHVSVAWVIENTQTDGVPMIVTRSNGTRSGGTPPVTTNVSIGKTLSDLSIASLLVTNRANGTATNYPEPIMSARIISSTNYELWVSNSGDTHTYRTEVVEWPTAQRDIEQNYYRFYVDNDLLDPTDPWPPGVDDLGENTAITGFDTPPASGDAVRIRMSLLITGGTMGKGVDSFRLEYGERITTCSAISPGQWNQIGDPSSTTAIWRGHDGTPADATALSGNPPTVGDLNISVSDRAGTYEESNGSALTPFDVASGEDLEFDWSIEHNGAEQKTSYCFRMVEADGTLFTQYHNYPTVRTAGYEPILQNWRWYDDETNITPTVPLAATNTSPADVENDNILKLRVTLQESAGATSTNNKFKLQFSQHSNFSEVTDVVSTSTCLENSFWCYGDGAGDDNATITATVLTDADTCSAGVGPGCGSHNEGTTTPSTFIHGANNNTEFEFTIQHAGARVNTVYFFRLYDIQNDEVVAASTTLPSVMTEGAQVTFSMLSIPSSTSIEGITTDVGSTATSVPFGSVPLDTELEGAQRLSIDTNGTEGYTVYLYGSSELFSSSGDTIAGVNASNTAPAAWTTGCSATSTGCFGYHSGDDTLAEGSTRFAPNNTYAALEGVPREVAFRDTPAASDTVDVVYKIQVRDLQPAGTYESNITYIIVPKF